MSTETTVTSSWQRWTIDEIDLGVVRLVVAEADVPIESTVAEAEATHAATDEIRERVFDVEDAPPDVLWGDERMAYVATTDLESFVKRRNRIRGLPNHRPLREGDVFWVVRPPMPEARSATTVQAMVRMKDAEIQVWDVTAAARQVAKRTYDQAVRSASDETPGPTPPEGA